MRLINGIFVWKRGYFGNSYAGFMGLSAGTFIKKEIKEPNLMLKFSSGLYCLVVMFLLLYILGYKTHPEF